MPGLAQDLRRLAYRFFPATPRCFYPARRRGLDHWATRCGQKPVAEVQRDFTLAWIEGLSGSFLELDAGDGVTGSHGVWLEEAGWRGFCFEERQGASQLIRKNRPHARILDQRPVSWAGDGVAILLARRSESIRMVLREMPDRLRPRRVILQARDPQPEIFRAMNRAGYRLDHFIHDDEYYRWKESKA